MNKSPAVLHRGTVAEPAGEELRIGERAGC